MDSSLFYRRFFMRFNCFRSTDYMLRGSIISHSGVYVIYAYIVYIAYVLLDIARTHMPISSSYIKRAESFTKNTTVNKLWTLKKNVVQHIVDRYTYGLQ